MKNRKLILIVSLVLAMAMSLGGTLAYLTDTDADVNTMVLGNVQIVQNEQQWNDDKSELVEFEQDKPLLPYVGTLGWENKEDQNGAYRRFTMNNVVDKYVTVTNKGNTNAYVRTIIALEMGEYENIDEYYYKIVGTSNNAANGSEFKFDGTWEWDEKYVAVIDNVNYMIMTATHKNPVAAKTTTIPSLLQVYVNKDCDNEELVKLDGNKNGKLDILVISQAVQADGFESAAVALSEAFSYGTDKATTVAGWFESIGDPDSDYQIGSPNTDPETGKNDTNNPPVFVAANAAELAELLAAGANNISLTEGVDYGTVTITGELKNVTIQGADGMDARFIIDAGAVLENVTMKGLELDYLPENGEGFAAGGAIVIKAGAQVKNLVIEDSVITGTGSSSAAVNIVEPSAQVTLKNVTTDGQKYAVYGYTACDSLVFEDCTFKNHSSWVVQFNGADNVGWNLTMAGNEFENCKGGVAKKGGTNHEDASVVFTDNILTNCTGHDGKDAKWFENLGKTGPVTVSGNTLDGAEFAPGAAQGLGN